MENANLRKPAVAGQFYSESSQKLKKDIEILLGNKKPAPKEAIAAMMPHAGYIYSGEVAAATAASLIVKNRIVILGPNHTGYGVPFAILTEGIWQMPFGDVEIDSELAASILKYSNTMEEDAIAHTYEHSLEVELPFLSYFNPDIKIVPIVVSAGDLRVYKEIGREIAATIKKMNIQKDTLIIASSDMTHYEPQNLAEKKDKEAIEAILELNEDKLMDKVERLNISMCGCAPAIIMIAAAKALGAKKGELVQYQTSGDVTGDRTSVVGYAGIIVH